MYGKKDTNAKKIPLSGFTYDVMAVEIVTKEDLNNFRQQLLEDLRAIINVPNKAPVTGERGYKTRDVREVFGCCRNTLTKWVIQKKLRRKKIEGEYYYNREDVQRLLEEGF